MCYEVVEAYTFSKVVLVCVTDVDWLPESPNIQAWVELSEGELAVSDGRVFLLRTFFMPYQQIFAELASFEECAEELLDIFMLVGVSMLSVEKFCGGVYHSFFVSMLPREFVNKPIDSLIAPVMVIGVRLRVNG